MFDQHTLFLKAKVMQGDYDCMHTCVLTLSGLKETNKLEEISMIADFLVGRKGLKDTLELLNRCLERLTV